MDVFSNQSQLFVDYFNHHPISTALYDDTGRLININLAMKDRYKISDKSSFFLGHLFENTLLTVQQKQELLEAKVIRAMLNFDQISIIPLKQQDKNYCTGYHLQFDDVVANNTDSIQYDAEIKRLTEKAAKKQYLLELALQNSRATVYSFDFRLFNKCDKIHCLRCFQFYGSKNNILKKNEYICRALPSLQHANDPADFFYLFNKIREEKLNEYTTSFRLKNNDGKYCNCEVVGKAQEIDDEGKANLIIGCLIDNQKYVEQEETLVKEKEEAQTADQLKSEFLANMTHDIRTPLHAIIGFSELLNEETDEELRLEYINLIKRNNELLVKLINDVLDISKIESNLLTFDYINVPLQPFMKDIYMTIKLKMNKDVELILDSCSNLVLNIDRNRLSQILINLLTNAIKHTPEGNIRFGYQQESGFIRFYIKDTGCGIPETEIKNIFTRFSQVKGRQKEGVGLGLAICKGLVTKMGGTISVTSKEQAGSTFSFTIPYTEKEIS